MICRDDGDGRMALDMAFRMAIWQFCLEHGDIMNLCCGMIPHHFVPG